MTAFVLDNSVTMRWCFQNAAHPYADGVLQQLAIGAAVVPVLWRYEVSAVLAKSLKDGILTPAAADAFLATLNSLNIAVDLDGPDHILNDVHRTAIAYRLTSYDAAYLELAIRRALPLATLDHELIAACKASGVALL
ncbi:type II toxin-antitoxin system VapC family toxin [Acidicapsa dinghuensis]|uniref:Type II toxin-antitoxin system VapC family toxin n=1 Tax=Acidicapsa dinghuensis TaxID=2218256 RepID=A0ABW1EL19_9BACT|nr:type II toxin-antitoxin system VapC family toxin [Acidicapsa dinghuensis]